MSNVLLVLVVLVPWLGGEDVGDAGVGQPVDAGRFLCELEDDAPSAPSAATTEDASSAAGGPACSSDADCDDGDDCTVDLCARGVCAFEAECETDADCDDENVCTIDECIGGCCEVRPQCFGDDDCGEGFRCEYNCCIRCPTCHEIRRVRSRCRGGRLTFVVVLRDEMCDGNTITIDVDGELVDCDVRGRVARCRARRVRKNATVCVVSPDCPEFCYDVSCESRRE